MTGTISLFLSDYLLSPFVFHHIYQEKWTKHLKPKLNNLDVSFKTVFSIFHWWSSSFAWLKLLKGSYAFYKNLEFDFCIFQAYARKKNRSKWCMYVQILRHVTLCQNCLSFCFFYVLSFPISCTSFLLLFLPLLTPSVLPLSSLTLYLKAEHCRNVYAQVFYVLKWTWITKDFGKLARKNLSFLHRKCEGSLLLTLSHNLCVFPIIGHYLNSAYSKRSIKVNLSDSSCCCNDFSTTKYCSRQELVTLTYGTLTNPKKDPILAFPTGSWPVRALQAKK